jgi:hypothetical protein
MPDRAPESLSLIQLRATNGARRVGVVVDTNRIALLAGEATTLALAQEAIAGERTLAEVVAARERSEELSFESIVARGALLPPIDHPDPAHLFVTGTGLTHLGSADARDRMHAAEPAAQTDSMKMFRAGLEGGRPEHGQVGVTPEWFYKGTGASLVGGDAPLPMPAFALDGGEEPEVAGVYVIGDDGAPYRLGFALANESSDHVLERQNYLLLAHSKLRRCAVGPELRTGSLPRHVRGVCRVRRGAETVWEKEFLTGEENMSHTLANLEHHHFKYDVFRRPGDVHVHTFGTATLSFADGVRCEPGDLFEISADAFRLPLRNPLARMAEEGWVGVRPL